MRGKIERVWVNPAAEDFALTRRVLGRLPDVPVQMVDEARLPMLLREMPLARGKRILYLTVQQGRMVEPCPATNPPYLCCRYTVINNANQCPMECSYCVLQAYLEQPVMRLHVNMEDIFQQIDQTLKDEPRRFFRFGTGELADSLALDPVTGLSADWLKFFRGKSNALIELKTKSGQIETALAHPIPNGVMAWSVNPPQIIESQEFNTLPLDKRLDAARRSQDAGFLTAFHFDPMIQFPDAEKAYEETVHAIFDSVDSRRIAWISLGALRFAPPLKGVIQKRFPKSNIVYDEMIRGLDGKMRYLRPERTALFEAVYRAIRQRSRDVFVYFCMEPPWVWQRVMGQSPAFNADLDFWFAKSLYQRFPELEMDEPDRCHYK